MTKAKPSANAPAICKSSRRFIPHSEFRIPHSQCDRTFLLSFQAVAAYVTGAHQLMRATVVKTLLLFPFLLLTFPLKAAEESPTAATPAPDGTRPFFERIFGRKTGNSKPLTSSPSRPATTPEPWLQFPAGSLPPGKVLNESEAAKLADGDYSGETIYLSGIFNVTAVGTNHAVLRYAPNPTSTAVIRIIVEYPPKSAPPPEGRKLKLDQSSGLLLRAASRAGDNTLNLRARQIAKPED